MKYVLPLVVLAFLFSCQPKPKPSTDESLLEKNQEIDSSEIKVEPQEFAEEPTAEDVNPNAVLLKGGWILQDYKELLNKTHSLLETQTGLPYMYTTLGFSGDSILYCDYIDWQEGDYVNLKDISFPNAPIEKCWLNISKLTEDTMVLNIADSSKGMMSRTGTHTYLKTWKGKNYTRMPGSYSLTFLARKKLEREWLSGLYHVVSDTGTWNMTVKTDGSISGHPKAEDAASTDCYGFTHGERDLMSFRFEFSDTLIKQSWLITESGKDFFKLQQVKNITEEDQPIELYNETLELRRIAK